MRGPRAAVFERADGAVDDVVTGARQAAGASGVIAG